MGKAKLKQELNSTQKIGKGLQMVRNGELEGFMVKKEKNLLDNNKGLAAKFKKRAKPTKEQILESRFQDVLREVDQVYSDTTTEIKNTADANKIANDNLFCVVRSLEAELTNEVLKAQAKANLALITSAIIGTFALAVAALSVILR